MSDAIELDALERELAGFAQEDSLVSMSDWVKRCLALPRGQSPARRIALLLDTAGRIYLQQPKAEAIGLVTAAESLAMDSGDRPQMRRALTIHALLLTSFGSHAEALDCLQRALTIADQLNDLIGQVTVWINAAVVMTNANLPEDAIRCYEAAAREIDRFPANFAAVSVPRIWQGVALSRLHLLDFAACIENCERVAALLTDEADMEMVQVRALSCCTHARALVAVGRFREAVELVRAADALAQKCGSVRARTESRAVGALVLICTGDVQKGLSLLATAGTEDGIDVGGRSDLLRTEIAAYEHAGRPDKALSTYKELMRLVQQARLEAIRARLESPFLAGDEPSAGSDNETHEAFAADRRGSDLVDLANRTRATLTRTRLSFAKI